MNAQPAPALPRFDWEERSAALGCAMAHTALDAGKALYVEYWNEPYLNWANFNRANFIPRFYDVSRAEEGGPVRIQHDGQEVPHLIWTRDRSHFRPFMMPGGLDRRLDHWRRGRLLHTRGGDENLYVVATGAELGFVARRLPGDTAELELNGTRIPLPSVMPPENNDGLHRLSLPLNLLQEENQIRIVVPNADSPGFFLGMWGLWIEIDASNSLEGGGDVL